MGTAELDLVEKGSAEVVAGYGRKAQPECLPGLPNSLAERTRRPGVVRRGTPRAPLGKHGLQSSNSRLTMQVGYVGFGQTSAQESTAAAITIRTQGFRKRRTVPPPEQAARSNRPVLNPAYGAPSIRWVTSVTDSVRGVANRRPALRGVFIIESRPCPRSSAWIEHRPPEPGAQVQILSGTPLKTRFEPLAKCRRSRDVGTLAGHDLVG